MSKPAHTFNIGQQVYHHTGGSPSGTPMGPYTIIGLLWQSGSAVRYCIKPGFRALAIGWGLVALARRDRATMLTYRD